MSQNRQKILPYEQKCQSEGVVINGNWALFKENRWKSDPPLLIDPGEYRLQSYPTRIIYYYCIFPITFSRDSSVGRASDWRSEGPWFKPGSRHILSWKGNIILNSCCWIRFYNTIRFSSSFKYSPHKLPSLTLLSFSTRQVLSPLATGCLQKNLMNSQMVLIFEHELAE